MEIVILRKENYQGTLHYNLVRSSDTDDYFVTAWGTPNQSYYSYYGSTVYPMNKWDHKYNAMVNGKGYREFSRHCFKKDDIVTASPAGTIFRVAGVGMKHSASPRSCNIFNHNNNNIYIVLDSIPPEPSFRFIDRLIIPTGVTKIDQSEFFTHFTNRVRYPEIYERYCIHTEGENNAESKNSASG